MVQRLTLRKKRKSQNVRSTRRRMTYRKMVHRQTLGKKITSQNVRGTRRRMTYRKTGRYNIEGGGVYPDKVTSDIDDKHVYTIPIFLGKFFINSDRSPLMQEDTIYSYDYRVAPGSKKIALEHILTLQQTALGDNYKYDIIKEFTNYRNYINSNYSKSPPTLQKGTNLIYFKISDNTPVSPPASPTSVMDKFSEGGGKRRQRRQQGLKQNKLQTIKKYYKNK